MLKQNIIDWTLAHKEEFLADLTKLCAIRSVREAAEPGKPFGPGPAAALEEGLRLCESYGFAVKNYDNYVGAADLAGDKPRMLDILAHLDVVGEGDGWDTDPYTATLKDDGCLYGRGVADDKGGLLAAAYAMRCVKELGLPLRYGCRLILGTDEETGMEDTRHYYVKEKPAPCTCTPDASFPVCNVEKGFYRPEFRKSWEPQTALPRVTQFHGGFRLNVVPTDAWCEILGMEKEHLRLALLPLCAELGAGFDLEDTPQGVKLTLHGRGCHAAEPEKGINGNTALIRVLTELPLADCESSRALRELDKLLPHGDWLGKAVGIAQSDDISGELTCSFTRLDFDEQGLWGACDCRVALCATKENCQDVMEAAMRPYGFAMSGSMSPGHHTPGDSEFIRTLLNCYEEYTGEKGWCYAMGGGTYVHHVPGGVAFGAERPGFDCRMHGANERMRVDHLLECIEIYAGVIARLCGEKLPPHSGEKSADTGTGERE